MLGANLICGAKMGLMGRKNSRALQKENPSHIRIERGGRWSSCSSAIGMGNRWRRSFRIRDKRDRQDIKNWGTYSDRRSAENGARGFLSIAAKVSQSDRFDARRRTHRNSGITWRGKRTMETLSAGWLDLALPGLLRKNGLDRHRGRSHTEAPRWGFVFNARVRSPEIPSARYWRETDDREADSARARKIGSGCTTDGNSARCPPPP